MTDTQSIDAADVIRAMQSVTADFPFDEFLVFDAPMSEDQLHEIGRYFMEKYGLI